MLCIMCKEIDLSEIESMGVKGLNWGKTILLSAAGLAGAIVLVSVLSGESDTSEPCPTPT